MDDSRAVINDAQRKALADIVVRRFNARIAVAQQVVEDLQVQIEKAKAKDFDPTKPEEELKRFRRLVDNLESRKRELAAVTTLERERDDVEQAVWLAATVEEAQRLVARSSPVPEAK